MDYDAARERELIKKIQGGKISAIRAMADLGNKALSWCVSLSFVHGDCEYVWMGVKASSEGGGGERGELALLIQLMKGLSSESSCPPLSASKFPACLISPLNVSREKARGQNRGG